jgi:uncharacterized protein YkwD
MRRARMARRSRQFIGLTALLLVLVAGATANAAETEAFAAAIAKINQYRSDHDRGTVTVDARLTKAARRHARAMADRDFFSHVGADGSNMGKRVIEAGYIWRLAAENIAAGMVGPADAIESWIDSPGHRQNLLLKGATHMGLAHVRVDPDPGSVNFKDYWVLLLAAPQ